MIVSDLSKFDFLIFFVAWPYLLDHELSCTVENVLTSKVERMYVALKIFFALNSANNFMLQVSKSDVNCNLLVKIPR